jgi:hypothetical protein
VTVSDIKKALQELKIRDEVASAEEFIERTAGVNQATSISYE